MAPSQVTKKNKEISLEEALKPYIRDIEEVLKVQRPFPTLYVEGVQYRVQLLKRFVSRMQQRYRFRVREEQ